MLNKSSLGQVVAKSSCPGLLFLVLLLIFLHRVFVRRTMPHEQVFWISMPGQENVHF